MIPRKAGRRPKGSSNLSSLWRVIWNAKVNPTSGPLLTLINVRSYTPPDLAGKVAVVAGATRGCGRGIATELGAAGATVYCTGRSARGNLSPMARPETIEETAEIVTAAGGKGVAVRVDHTRPEEVEALFGKVESEQGRLDILVNDVWGGETLIEWDVPAWEAKVENALTILPQVLHSHLITARYGVPLILKGGRGLVVEVTDGDGYHFRGNYLYDLTKILPIRLAQNLTEELNRYGHPEVTSLAITPGYLRSEQMLDGMGLTESNWASYVKNDKHWGGSETPRYIGRAIARLAADPAVHRWHGKALSTWGLKDEYGLVDADDRVPGESPLPDHG